MYLIILGLYLLLDFVFSAKISFAKNIKYFLYLVVTFPILHISYGLGFILGILNFYIIKNSKIEEKK